MRSLLPRISKITLLSGYGPSALTGFRDLIKGIHLLSKGGMSSDVAKAFNIQGVPRYMIIGKDGRIVNSDATRPSQPETAETLRKLLSI